MKLGLSLTLILMAAPCLADISAGITSLSDTSRPDRPLELSIWYPSDEQTTAMVGQNAVFRGGSRCPERSAPVRAALFDRGVTWWPAVGGRLRGLAQRISGAGGFYRG